VFFVPGLMSQMQTGGASGSTITLNSLDTYAYTYYGGL
jgi:hypothetical protein